MIWWKGIEIMEREMLDMVMLRVKRKEKVSMMRDFFFLRLVVVMWLVSFKMKYLIDVEEVCKSVSSYGKFVCVVC